MSCSCTVQSGVIRQTRHYTQFFLCSTILSCRRGTDVRCFGCSEDQYSCWSAFAKLGKGTVSFIMCVLPFAWNNSGPL